MLFFDQRFYFKYTLNGVDFNFIGDIENLQLFLSSVSADNVISITGLKEEDL